MDNELPKLIEQYCGRCEQYKGCLLLDKFQAVLPLSSDDCVVDCNVRQWLKANEQFNR